MSTRMNGESAHLQARQSDRTSTVPEIVCAPMRPPSPQVLSRVRLVSNGRRERVGHCEDCSEYASLVPHSSTPFA
ncbi:hypothetical protein OE88DRAFT_1667164 [Heliocybe sulcata]|uniref:Uncharacterized protein n=1 Tax=Heliocybe sulcata TaxID=5364 RepID=A0A5C3MSY6_9AGAM|nr:hypothetical protein OE88DRAFT_1667164 [Heliocybe sulcata]